MTCFQLITVILDSMLSDDNILSDNLQKPTEVYLSYQLAVMSTGIVQ
jgi:hypothetical protein